MMFSEPITLLLRKESRGTVAWLELDIDSVLRVWIVVERVPKCTLLPHGHWANVKCKENRFNDADSLVDVVLE